MVEYANLTAKRYFVICRCALFTVYHSNQVDILKSLLVELIKSSPLNSPFKKEQILVQSPGMSQWLKMALADELGIAANIEFPLPATFIWNMFVTVLDDVPEKSAFNKEAMTWKIVQVLPEKLELAEFSALKKYLSDDGDGSRLYQLAEKIADVFDGYLVYRPEWIASWEAGKAVAELDGEQPWQPMLWQALYDHTLMLNQSPYHRANLYEEFIDKLENYTDKFADLPERLFVFGISSLPPRYMDALKALGEHMDVHLMFTNPCRYYWGEVRDRKFLARLEANSRKHLEWCEDHSELSGESLQLKGSLEQNLADELHTHVVGNGLLASMGKLGRDNMYLLSQLASNEIEAFVDIDRESLLQQIQADILNLEERQDDENLLSSSHKNAIDTDDLSLTLNGCHSPVREVEVLHDSLLRMFEQNPQLKPRDIIVMVADINAYSPAIQAVFGNAPSDRYIPYSISDRTAQQESPVLSSFLELVGLPFNRCHASELLELLETPEIMARFDLTDAEFGRLRLWIEEVGIRWGVDSGTATEFDLPEMEQNSWLFGIQRMLMGYAMHESSGFYQSAEHIIAPYNEVQGLDAELAGKLAEFISRIAFYRKELAGEKTASQWQACLYQMSDDFFLVQPEGEVAVQTIRDTLQHLSEQLDSACYQDKISLPVLTEYLQGKLSSSSVSQRFLAGQVNFCTLMPMRSIPFDVVCLLGMNDGIYPRTVAPEGFDLINGRSRAGDRSRRDDDRYLFLEALLSAQRTLYISYLAHSIQDNSELAPSILVSELLEYCGANFCLKGDEQLESDSSAQRLISNLTYHHPMVPYSRQAFSSDNPSYAAEWLAVAAGELAEKKAFVQPLDDYLASIEKPLELPLAELQRFWKLPVRYFFNRRLKVYFESSATDIIDEEPFILSGLDSYQLREEMLATMIGASEDEQLSQKSQFHSLQRAKGSLPVGAFGELEFENNSDMTQALAAKLNELCNQPESDGEVNLEIALTESETCVRLTGWLKQRYSSGLVRYRCGRIRSQDWLAGWLDHLCAAASDLVLPTHLIGYDNKSGIEHKLLKPVDKAQALQWLSELTELYYQGMNQPLAYFPKTAFTGIERQLKGKEDTESKMAQVFNDSYSFAGEGSDAYISRVWPEWNNALYQSLMGNAQQVLLNVLACSEDKQDV